MRKNHATQLLSILLFILSVVGGLVFVLPLSDQVQISKTQRDTLAVELQSAQSDFERLSLLSEEISSSEAVKQSLLDAVPSGFSQDQLILDLESLSDDLDFDLNSMSFSDSVDPELGKALVVSANLSGDVDELIQLLQNIENAQRLMQVTSLNVQLTNSSDILFNLNIEAYYQ